MPPRPRPLKAAQDACGDWLDGLRCVELTRVRAGRASGCDDRVACEEPLEIRVAGAALVVTMRTPGHDEELALGFLLSEGVVQSAADVTAIRHCSAVSDPDAEDNVLQVTLRPDVRVELQRFRRNFQATSSCGVCGKTSIEAALRSAPPLEDLTRFTTDFFAPLPERMRAAQTLFSHTGGLHGAALFAADGALLVAREDIGRHNAVDKVIGWAAADRRMPLAGTCLLVSGRISYEIAQKALAARIPVVAAVSAPSSLAVELAERARLTLVGFLRDGAMNVYGYRDRVVSRGSVR
ncbi:MAG: formate dehydrogenase accessory sulfurtransferase FdhD [Deltaproteobacteria bacterium]|nr:MAG: formate dehydrogenase accessory sulfurtransferase FdhD [Deltaproteobacteria bacterium]